MNYSNQDKKTVRADFRLYLSVAVAGHVDAGKTSFTSALTKTVSLLYPEGNRFIPLEKIDRSPEERQRGVTITATHIPLFLQEVAVSISDCPGHEDYLKNMIEGAVKSDAVILMVSTTSGVQPQTSQHVAITSELDIRDVFVVYNKIDLPEASELLELVKEEVHELLETYNMNLQGEIEISATAALQEADLSCPNLSAIKNLVQWLGTYQPQMHDEAQGFKMGVDEIYNPIGQGVILTGRVISGQISRNDDVLVVGMNRPQINGRVKNIQTFGQDVSKATRGMDLGLSMTNVTKDNIRKGMMVMSKNVAYQLKDAFSMLLEVKKDTKHGRMNKFGVGFEPQFILKYIGVPMTGKITAINGAEYMMPGEIREVHVKLLKPLVIFPEAVVSVSESGNIIGHGRVKAVL